MSISVIVVSINAQPRLWFHGRYIRVNAFVVFQVIPVLPEGSSSNRSVEGRVASERKEDKHGQIVCDPTERESAKRAEKLLRVISPLCFPDTYSQSLSKILMARACVSGLAFQQKRWKTSITPAGEMIQKANRNNRPRGALRGAWQLKEIVARMFLEPFVSFCF